MYDQLKGFLDQITPLDKEEWLVIKNSFSINKIPAKSFLTSVGEVEKKIYFLSQGIIRLFCFNPKGEEITVFLFKENFFASCYESFLTKTPGNQALETLEDCTVLSISKTSLENLYLQVPKMNIIARIIAEQRFINSQRIFSSHILLTPEERYLQFEQMHGDLLLRVPHHIIASFLGVTPVSLSRIRKRIYKR